MFRALQNVTNEHNWVYFWLRWVKLALFGIFIFIAQQRTWFGLDAITDILNVAGIGVVVTLVLVPFIYARFLRDYFFFIATPGDWIITGLYVYLIANNILAVTLITSVMIITGMMRFGSGLAIPHSIGVIGAAIAAMAANPAVGQFALMENMLFYAPSLLMVVLIAIISGVWSHTRDEINSQKSREMRKTMEDNNRRLDNMRERTRFIAELGARLNATLEYEKILDAALDIGRLSLRNAPKQRVVSMVILVEEAEKLAIATSRGVNYLDENRKFRAESGILARALENGAPRIEQEGESDPELGTMIAFKNIASTLVIPLRAGYDTYGAVVYGSTDPDAFNVDTLDTLRAIALQATVALQNAVLYSTLREEKERIVAIEESARRELVRDLHDVPAQTMSAVSLRLGVIPRMLERHPEQVLAEVDEIRNLAKRATDEIRYVLFSLRPLALETQGLSVALGQLADKMETTYSQPVKLELNPQAETLLEANQQGSLFYLIEEAANNARKYANATLIRITLDIVDKAVVTCVIDNGDGFDTSLVSSQYENRGSFGMVNMRERAELIGGQFELASTPGRGTTVTVRIVIDEEKLATMMPMSAPFNETQSMRPRKRLDERRKRSYTGPLSPST